jgi:hypothetical protein
VTFVHVDCAVDAVLTLVGSGVGELVRVLVGVVAGVDGTLGAGLDTAGVLGGAEVDSEGVGVGVAAVAGVVTGVGGVPDDVHPAIRAAPPTRTATSRYAGRWSRAGC